MTTEDNNKKDQRDAYVFLELNYFLTQKGVKNIILKGNMMCVQYKDQSIPFTLHRDDPGKTFKIFDSMVNGTLEAPVKEAIKTCILNNWFKQIYNNESNEKSTGLTKAELVLETAKEHYTKLFVDEYQNAHAAISVNNHLEVISLRSKRFKNWISKILYKEAGIVVDSQILKDVIGVLTAEAEFDSGAAVKLGLRVASVNDTNEKTKWYYDLTNEKWEFIEITSEGWKIVNNLIIFRRFSNQSPQVYPSRDYHPDIFDRLMKLLLDVNIEEENKEDYRLLIKCYIIYLFVPDLIKPVLMPHGHQGGAKTTLLESIKMLIDPCIIKTLSFPCDNELV